MAELETLLLRVSAELRRIGVAHAFGGAIALAFWAPPRATNDIDLAIFAADREWTSVFDALEAAGFEVERDLVRFSIHKLGEFRLVCGNTELDVFTAFASFHDEVRKRIVDKPWRENQHIFVVSAEDLIIFKVMFDRGQDWVDIEAIAAQQGARLDLEYIRRWLPQVLPQDDPRSERLQDLVEAVLSIG